MPIPQTPATFSGGQPLTANTQAVTTTTSGVTIKNFGDVGDAYRKCEITLTNVSLSITDSAAYGGTKIASFPKCLTSLIDATSNLTFTTSSAIASTLNAGASVQYGLGTATASATTLATTMIDVVPGTAQTVPTFTSSSVINTASAAVTNYLKAVAKFDGSGTAKDIYINAAVGTGTDIDGDATVLVNGTIVLVWGNVGLAS